MESQAEIHYNEVFVPEIKVEYDSDSSDCGIEKMDSDPLTEGAIVNDVSEVCMPVIRGVEVKFKSSECVNDQLTILEEECLTWSNNEDISRMSSGVSHPSCSINIIPTLQNSEQQHQDQFLCHVPSSSNAYNSEEIKSQHTPSAQPFTCNICKKSFTQRGHLNRHQRNHTNEHPFICNICNRSFTQKEYLSIHQRSHTNERPFVCKICNKSFTHRGNLNRHQRTHTNEHPFACNICEKSFTNRGNLNRHQSTHTNEQAFTCNICDKSFALSEYLSIHQRTHANERPFICNICNKSFNVKLYMVRHQLTHANQLP